MLFEHRTLALYQLYATLKMQRRILFHCLRITKQTAFALCPLQK